MKINSNPIRGAAVIALLAGLSPSVFAQMETDTTRPMAIEPVAQSEASRLPEPQKQQQLRKRSANELTGMNVHNRSGESLGEIKDFVIDAKSGQVVYAVVGSGGVLGIGETLHAVPASALQHETVEDGERLTLNIDSARWAQAPRFKKDKLTSLQGDEEGRSTFEYYGQVWQESSPSLSMREPIQRDAEPSAQQSPESQLVMATNLIGKNIRSGAQEVGEVEDILLQFENRSAAVLLDPEDDFTGTDQKYIVPFNKVMLQGQDTLTTSLSREDFSSAQIAQGDSWAQSGGSNLFVWPGVGASAAGAIERAGEGIARTGERAGDGIERAGDRFAEGAERTGDRVAGEMERPAQQGLPPVAEIRRALQNDSMIAQQAGRNVQVIAEGDKVVLLGTVQSEQAKDQIEQRVQQTAPGWNVENQIRVATAEE